MLKADVERILREQGSGSVRPASGRHGHSDGFVVEEAQEGSVLVRCGPESVTLVSGDSDPTTRPASPGLRRCAELLSDAGLRIRRAQDARGRYLEVSPGR